DRIDNWLKVYFEHDFVFVLDPADRLLYSLYGIHSAYQNWFEKVRSELNPVVDGLRGRKPARAASESELPAVEHAVGTARIHAFLGRPAVIAGVLVAKNEPAADTIDRTA